MDGLEISIWKLYRMDSDCTQEWEYNYQGFIGLLIFLTRSKQQSERKFTWKVEGFIYLGFRLLAWLRQCALMVPPYNSNKSSANY